MSLENNLNKTFEKMHISKKQQRKLWAYLEVIKEKDIETYHHSIALGLKMKDAVKDRKAGLYAGLLHDIGKISIEDEVLKKKEFDEKDMEEMKKHPVYSFLLLGEFAFSGAVSFMHHWNQKNSYPVIKNFRIRTIIGSKNPKSFEKAKKYAHILHEIDSDDASHYRENNYFELNKEIKTGK